MIFTHYRYHLPVGIIALFFVFELLVSIPPSKNFFLHGAGFKNLLKGKTTKGAGGLNGDIA